MAQNNTTASDGHVYTLRKGGVVCVTSHAPDCGYSTQELKELRAAGYILYCDGKRVQNTKA